MSKLIKSLTLALLFSFTHIHTVMASDLKVLTFKEFQEIKNSPKIGEEKLDEYEINNSELINLQKVNVTKKHMKKKFKTAIPLIGKLTSI